jgi:Tfp pilus assembly protein PilX
MKSVMTKSMQEGPLARQAGQVGVIVLLISAIILVIGLSIASRTIKESQSTITAEDSARVFSTAESGIQQALGNIFQFESAENVTLPADFSFADANLNQVSIVAQAEFEAFCQKKMS